MNMFLDPHFWELKTSAELWVLVGLIIFIAICVLAGAPRMAAKALDGKAAKIQSELDEAARLSGRATAFDRPQHGLRHDVARADDEAVACL